MTLGHRQHGAFTIVELIIVVVVIAILASVVVVAYNSVSSNAREAQLKSDLMSAAAQLARYNLRDGGYPDSGDALERSKGTILIYSGSTEDYCLSASLESAPQAIFHVTRDEKLVAGGCPVTLKTIATGMRIAGVVMGAVGLVTERPRPDMSRSRSIRLVFSRGRVSRAFRREQPTRVHWLKVKYSAGVRELMVNSARVTVQIVSLQ